MMDSQNLHFAYRLRSLDKLLDKDYNELERQTIYLAPFSELNDPMEGIGDIVWLGDGIVWESLFKYFLLCMEYKVSMATLYLPEDSEQFFKDDFPIHISESTLPTDIYRKHFDIIKKRFFSYEPIIAFIDYLGHRKLPIGKNQLSAILSLISRFALESILYGHDQANFQPQPFWCSLQTATSNPKLTNTILAMINRAKALPEKEVDSLLWVTNSIMSPKS